jgi:phage gp36-like protein
VASTYSSVTDLLIGELNTHRSIDRTKFVDDAADEVDSYLGYRYLTPINMTDSGPVSRPARLIIKRIANHLASGRLLMAQTAHMEDDRVHAYGSQLVVNALNALEQLSAGSPPLEGAILINTEDADFANVGAAVVNVDPESPVEYVYKFLRGETDYPLGWVPPPWIGGG